MNRDKWKVKALRVEALEDRRVLATFTVNDFGDAAQTINSCGAPPVMLNLRDAVALANQCPGGDTILFTAGTNTIALNSKIAISDDLIIRGGLMPNRGSTVSPEITIQGAPGVYGGAFCADDGSSNVSSVTIDGLRLTGGIANYGGAIFSREALTVTNSIIEQNIGSISGGGIASVAGSLTLLNSTIQGNTAGLAIFGYGGGVYASTDVEISDSAISGNYQVGGDSAAAYFTGNNVVITRTEIEGNNDGNQVAMTFNPAAVGSIEISASTVSGNEGEVILNLSNGSLASISDSALVNNNGVLRVTGGQFMLTTSTVSGNHGAIVGQDSTILIERSTIANTPGLAVSANASSSLTIEGSILSDNGGAFDIGGGASPTVNYSLVEGDPGLSGTGNILGVPAQLGPLTPSVNGARETLIYPLLPTSPAVDAGSPAVTSGFDQRRFLRVVDGDSSMAAVVDMGSFEYGSAPPEPCDSNGDGSCGIDDLNTLTSDIASGIFNPYSDLNGDGVLSETDLLEWLTIAGALPENAGVTGGNPFLQADADLDGTVDGDDFLDWFDNRFSVLDEYGGGDFNADGSVDAEDFLIWNNNKFMSALRPLPDEEEDSVAHREVYFAIADWIIFGEEEFEDVRQPTIARANP